MSNLNSLNLNSHPTIKINGTDYPIVSFIEDSSTGKREGVIIETYVKKNLKNINEDSEIEKDGINFTFAEFIGNGKRRAAVFEASIFKRQYNSLMSAQENENENGNESNNNDLTENNYISPFNALKSGTYIGSKEIKKVFQNKVSFTDGTNITKEDWTSMHKAFKKKTKASSDVSGLKRSSSKLPNATVTSSLSVVASTTASSKIASSNKEWNQLAKNNLISYNGENNWKISTTEPHTNNNIPIPNAIKIRKRDTFIIIKKNNYRKVNGSSAAPAAAPETGVKAATVVASPGVKAATVAAPTGSQFGLNPIMLAQARAKAPNNNDDDDDDDEEWNYSHLSETQKKIVARRAPISGNASGTGAPPAGLLAGLQVGLKALKTLSPEEQAKINAEKAQAAKNAKTAKLARQGGVPSFAEAAQEKAHALHEAAAAAAAANEVVANGTKIIYNGNYEDLKGKQATIMLKLGTKYKIQFNNSKKTILTGVNRNQFKINNSVVASSSNAPPTNPKVVFSGSGTGSKPANYGYTKASGNYQAALAKKKAANSKVLQNAAKALQNAENAKLKVGDYVMQKNGTDPKEYRFLRNDPTNKTKIIISKPHKEPGKYLGSLAPSKFNYSSVNKNLYVKVPPPK